MNRSTITKLGRFILIIILDLAAVGALLLMLSSANHFQVATQIGGWTLVIGAGWLLWQRRMNNSWRYIVATAMTLATLLQLTRPAPYLPVAPVARAATIEVTTLVDNATLDGACSLREAIQAANTNLLVIDCLVAGTPGVDTITFDPSLDINETIILSGSLQINESLTIQGNSGGPKIDGDNLDRIFLVTAGNMTIQNLTIQNGATDSDGGGILDQGSGKLTLQDTVVTNNQANRGGGLAKTGNGQVLIDASTIKNNNSNGNGAGFFHSSSQLVTIQNGSIIQDNEVTSEGSGGGIAAIGGGEVKVNGSTIQNNTAIGNGGGISRQGSGKLTVQNNSLIVNNTTTITPGGDTLEAYGGGIAVVGSGQTIVKDTTIESNTAVGDGGGIAHNGTALLDIDNSIISGNIVTGLNEDGGGIAIRNSGLTDIFGSSIANNMALNGTTNSQSARSSGGGINYEMETEIICGTLKISRSAIYSNQAHSHGGGLATLCPLTMDNTTISSNQNIRSGARGGGIYFEGGQAAATLTHVTIAHNSAPDGEGGGISDRTSGSVLVDLRNILIANNTAPTSPDCFSNNGLDSTGVNLVEDTSGCSGLDSDDLEGDPKLDSQLLANGTTTNAGPTHALLLGSSAVDKGTSVFCVILNNDQRGIMRVDQPGVGTAGSKCDLGAYEFEPVPVPSVKINDVTQVEGAASTTTNVQFTVTMEGSPVATDMTVDFTTLDGPAAPSGATTSDDDYLATSDTVTFSANTNTPQTIDVTVNGDDVPELNETFFVTLSNSNWVTITDGQGEGVIQNDDDPEVSVTGSAVEEGDSGLSQGVVFTFTLSAPPPPGKNVRVDYQTKETNPASAAEGSDYIADTKSVTFTESLNSKLARNATILVMGDALAEEDETFLVEIINVTNATINTSEAEGIILDDDTAKISINNVTIDEGDSGTKKAVFTVSVSKPPQSILKADYTTGDGTASLGKDYQSKSGQVSFAIGDTTPKTIEVDVIGDMIDETDEDFLVTLSNVPLINLRDGEGRGLILDDDEGIGGNPVYLPIVLK